MGVGEFFLFLFLFCWIKNFVFGRKIKVWIQSDLSNQYMVVKGTPQGNVINLLFFIIMIDDVSKAQVMKVGMMGPSGKEVVVQ